MKKLVQEVVDVGPQRELLDLIYLQLQGKKLTESQRRLLCSVALSAVGPPMDITEHNRIVNQMLGAKSYDVKLACSVWDKLQAAFKAFKQEFGKRYKTIFS